jgi:hypothetical protein
MAAPQPIENQQRSYEVFEKKHYMECTTMTEGCRPQMQCLRKPQLAHVKTSGSSVKAIVELLGYIPLTA